MQILKTVEVFMVPLQVIIIILPDRYARLPHITTLIQEKIKLSGFFLENNSKSLLFNNKTLKSE
jgi:hypothetical protein